MRRRGALLALVAVAAWLAWRRSFRVVVEGESMAPALRHGDQLLCVRRGRIRRGDVVIVRAPGRSFEVVKRVTGIPGDPMGERTLGEEEYQVEGDDPLRSTDGRSFGPVARHEILGVAVLRYLPEPRFL
ncbi:MAG TPA: S26 family signal peptidase [Actinomycetota bacterium]